MPSLLSALLLSGCITYNLNLESEGSHEPYSGEPAGEPAGEMVGEMAGEPAGEMAGEMAGEPAGEMAGAQMSPPPAGIALSGGVAGPGGTAPPPVCPLDAPCDDDDPCTYDDRCDETGACVGEELSCSSDACVERWCDGTATCASRAKQGEPCDDGVACTHSDRCDAAGVCVGTSISCPSSECVQRSCDGTASCVEVYTTQSCDDGQLCTYNDRCQGGVCRGDELTCPSDDCVTRSCNGTNQCSATIHTGRACGVAPACKSQSCDTSGVCVQSSLVNGTLCGSAAQRCCSGSCVNTDANPSHCGGCGIACQEGYACYAFNGTGLCGCGGVNIYCRAGARNTATCYNPGDGWRCNCQGNNDCASEQTCQRVPGNNYCSY